MGDQEGLITKELSVEMVINSKLDFALRRNTRMREWDVYTSVLSWLRLLSILQEQNQVSVHVAISDRAPRMAAAEGIELDRP